jgi:hypothetical protein
MWLLDGTFFYLDRVVVNKLFTSWLQKIYQFTEKVNYATMTTMKAAISNYEPMRLSL